MFFMSLWNLQKLVSPSLSWALWWRLSFWLPHYYVGIPRLIEPRRTRHIYGLQPVHWNMSSRARGIWAWAGFHLTCFLSRACWRLCGKISYQVFSEWQVMWRRQDFRFGDKAWGRVWSERFSVKYRIIKSLHLLNILICLQCIWEEKIARHFLDGHCWIYGVPAPSTLYGRCRWL